VENLQRAVKVNIIEQQPLKIALIRSLAGKLMDRSPTSHGTV